MNKIKRLLIAGIILILIPSSAYALRLEATPSELQELLGGNFETFGAVANPVIFQSATLVTPVATDIDFAVGGLTTAAANLYVDTANNKVYINGAEATSGTVTSVAMTVPTGLSISGSPITTTGTLALSLASGYNIPLTASTSNWETFYNTPSNRITAGTNISWSTNTLNVDDAFLLNTGDTATGDYTITGSLAVTASTTFNGIEYLFPGADGSADQVLKTNGLGGLSWVDAGGGTFVSLSDTPANYTSAGSKCVKVNAGADALEFGDCAPASSVGGVFATSTDNILAYMRDGSDSNPFKMLIGGSATTTDVYVELTASSTDGYLAVSGSSNPGGIFMIDSNGNIGINDSTPSYKLDVNGTMGVTGASTFTGNITSLGTLTGANIVATSSIDIPSGAAPTVDAEGEIAIDTTSDTFRYYGAAERSLSYKFDKSLSVASSTYDIGFNQFKTATTTWTVWNPQRAVELTNLYCKTDVGTVRLRCGDSTNFTEVIVCDATGEADDGSITNGTFTAREDFKCEVGTSVTNPNGVTITATFKNSLD